MSDQSILFQLKKVKKGNESTDNDDEDGLIFTEVDQIQRMQDFMEPGSFQLTGFVPKYHKKSKDVLRYVTALMNDV